MLQIGECSTVRLGYQDKLYNHPSYQLFIFLVEQSNFNKYEPPSKPEDDICRVSGPIFAIIYKSLGFEALGVRILVLIV
jgi:hypothetical protein